jgi:hypothetical protein
MKFVQVICVVLLVVFCDAKSLSMSSESTEPKMFMWPSNQEMQGSMMMQAKHDMMNTNNRQMMDQQARDMMSMNQKMMQLMKQQGKMMAQMPNEMNSMGQRVMDENMQRMRN